MLTNSDIKTELKHLDAWESTLQAMIDGGPEGVLYYRKERMGDNSAIPYVREKQGSKYRTRSLAKADKRYIHRLRRKTYALHVLPAVKERKRLARKIVNYAQAGIYLGINFFVFAEHPTDGLDMVSIERMLRAIFDL